MICSLLVFSSALPSAYHALKWYEWARGGKGSGVTIPGQIRWVAMLERWLRMQSAGLLGDALSTSAAPHQLRAVTLGPLYDLTCKPGHTVFIQVGLGSRHVDDVYWYPVSMATITTASLALVLPESGPVWTDIDGVISIKISGLAGRGSSKVSFSVWWHHNFLFRDGPHLYLELAKVWLDGLHKDVRTNYRFPASFKLVAEFADLACSTRTGALQYPAR